MASQNNISRLDYIYQFSGSIGAKQIILQRAFRGCIVPQMAATAGLQLLIL
jgi:hypothetical protein